MKSSAVPLAVPDSLIREVRAAAKRTGLSQADVMRQSIKLGLPKLVETLSRSERVTNVDALPEEVLRKLYAERAEDEESIQQFIAAQPKEAE